MAREKYNRLRFDSREKDTIKEFLREYVVATRPELESDIFESKLGDLHMDALSFLMEGLAVQQDVNAQEVFLETCERYSSALKHSRTLGYKPKRAIPSSVTCVINPIPTALFDNGGTVKAGTSFVSGDINYEVLEDAILDAGLGSYSFSMTEGVSQEEEYESDGSEFITLETSVNNDARMTVAEDSWQVTVDEVVWEEVESIFTVLDAENNYHTEQTDEGQLRVIFGDNIHGRIPEAGAIIRITYRDCLGVEGLIPAESVVGNIVVDSLPDDLRVSIVNPEASAGAIDREHIDSIRRLAPAFFKTVDKLIVREDYETLASGFSDTAYGAVAKAVVKLREGTLLESQGEIVTPVIPSGTTIDIAGNTYVTLGALDLTAELNPSLFVDPNTVDVYLWGKNVTVAKFGPVSSGLKESFLTYAGQRSVVTVRVNVKDGGNYPIDLNFGEIIVDRAFKLDSPDVDNPGVNQNIESAFDSFFTDPNLSPGDTFRVSDIVNLIEQVPGILHFELDVTSDVEVGDTELYVRGDIQYTTVLDPRDTSDFRGRY